MSDVINENHQPDHVDYTEADRAKAVGDIHKYADRIQDKTIHPNYYKDQGNGSHDLAYHENAMFPRDWVIGNCVINAIKYLKRFPQKNGIEDVKKCRTYVDRLINVLSNRKD